MIGTRRAYLVALRDGVLDGAAAVIRVYVPVLLLATTGTLTGVLGGDEPARGQRAEPSA
ncbi:hypothetical protein [Trujillonella humicola]|uniref:hypothetical protein n=1 Tax=Trujillonella humicola TaxID=3383699 RepID=UPI0039065CF6